jgi:hypothetical protein
MIQVGVNQGLVGCRLSAPMAAGLVETGTQIKDEQNGIARDGVITNGVAESLLCDKYVMTLRLVVPQTTACT